MSTIKKIQAGTITYDIEPANAAELDVTNKASTLSWNNTSTIATVNGTNITVKLPENPNVDTKTTQSNTTTANWRKVVLSAQNNATASTEPVAQTGQVYVSTGLEYQPSSGSLQVGGPIRANGGFILSNDSRIGGDYYGGETIYSPAPCLLLVEAGSDTELMSISDNSELQLKNLSTPYDSGDAINKGYLESQLAGKASNTHTHTGPNHSHTYAEATSVTFTGTEGTTEDDGSHKHTFTGSAVNTNEKGEHSHTFTGSAATSTAPGGTTPTIAVATSNHTHSVTAEGTLEENGTHTHSVTAKGTLNSTGTHTHSVTAEGILEESGAHIHSVTASGTLNSTGAHTHSVTAKGTLNSTGAHTHALSSNVVTGSLSGTVLTLTSSAVTASSAGSHSHTFTGSAVNTNEKGSHSHTFTGSAVDSSSAGDHSHTFTGSAVTSSSAGDHSHTFTGSAVNTNEKGSHAHTFTGSAVTSGTPSATATVASETHTHNVTAKGSLSTNGDHTHSVTAKGTLNNAGSHNHTFTPEGTNTLGYTTANTGNSGTGNTSAPK